jgi:16S rRNA (cytosine967-C5)-methyltransferase
MVNAVLRKLAAFPKPEPVLPPNLTPAELAEATAHPAWLVERWVANYGPEAARDLCLHGQREPELTIRLNLAEPQQEAELAEQGIVLQPGALLSAARRVAVGDITATRAFQTSQIRIQDEGSQLIAELAGHGARILDCCAAPGGKTLILSERNPQSQITACELNPARFAALRQRIAEAEAQDPSRLRRIQVIQADAAEPFADSQAAYDLILADVPCSGTGTLGRNPEIRHRLDPADLARHHQRQCAILQGALGAASRRVVYSTCSLEPEENAEVIAEVLAQNSGWRQISLTGQIRELLSEGRLTASGAASLQTRIQPDGSLTLLPGNLGPGADTDGFFVAMLEKRQ